VGSGIAKVEPFLASRMGYSKDEALIYHFIDHRSNRGRVFVAADKRVSGGQKVSVCDSCSFSQHRGVNTNDAADVRQENMKKLNQTKQRGEGAA
jgi:hypothetical protein